MDQIKQLALSLPLQGVKVASVRGLAEAICLDAELGCAEWAGQNSGHC